MCGAGLPRGIDKGEAVLILLVNIVAPGVGTMLSACLGDCKCDTVFVGILQLLTAPLLIGWVWAICWALKLLRRCKRGGRDVDERDEGYAHTHGHAHGHAHPHGHSYVPPPPVAT